MSNPERPEAGDDIQVEVSHLRASAGAPPPSPSRSPFAPRYTRRQRLVRVIVGLLALMIIVGGITGVGGRVLGLLTARTPAATPTLTLPPVSGPGFSPPLPAHCANPVTLTSNAFYLLPNPPGVAVALDGRTLTSVPPPCDPHPLRLASGHHVFTWTSHVYPFTPLRCTLSMPSTASDTCPIQPRDLPTTAGDLSGHVISLHAALDTLPAGDVVQLIQAIQTALDANRFQATVQRGEHYLFYYQKGETGDTISATQPLRATLRYSFLPASGYFEPCILGLPAIPCRLPGQDCTQLCTVPQPPAAVITSPNDWIAAAEVHAAWTYTTLNGHVVARDVGESFGIQLAVLHITWDGVAWHVTPILGTTPGLPAADDLVCDPARYWVGANNTWSFMLADPPPGAQTWFISDATPTDGCLVVLSQHPPEAPSGVFLERFGVLLAVNDVATNGGSAGLPVADAAERQLAQKLATQAGLSIP